MGEHSTAVTSLNAGLMVIAFFLMLFYSSTVSLGISHIPGGIRNSLYTGHVDKLGHFSDNDNTDYKAAYDFLDVSYKKEVGVKSKPVNEGLHGNSYNSQNRDSNLKTLLENLTDLQQRDLPESLARVTEALTDMNTELESRRRDFSDKRRISQILQKSRSNFLSDILLRLYSNKDSTPAPQHALAQFEVIPSSSDDRQMISPTRTTKTPQRASDSIENYFSILEEVLKVKESDNNKVSQDFNLSSDNSWQTGENNVLKNLHGDTPNNALFAFKRNYPINYLVTPPGSSESVDVLRTPDTVYTKSLQTDAVNSHTLRHNDNIFGTAGETRVASDSKTGSVESLIHDTVKKMEGIMEKRVYQYDGFLALPDDSSNDDNVDTSVDDSAENEDGAIDRDYMRGDLPTGSIPINEDLAKGLVYGDKDIDHNDNEKSSYNKNGANVDLGDVTADVIKVVTSRKVPKDAEFWRRVSAYLDSSDYLSRTKRSPEGKKRHNGHRYMRLTITYGHVMPCEYKDRFYCMNGGTCVFVGALDIRTCRCPIGYTGVRCELIDQEYILSLLTNTLIFS